MDDDQKWQDQVISNLISRERDQDSSQRLVTQTGYETTEFTTDSAGANQHLRSTKKKDQNQNFAVDFTRDHSESDLRKAAQTQVNEDLENLYTTEGEENETRKSIIRSELKDEGTQQ